MNSLDPLLRDFVLFCAKRCGGDWPALYDEMTWVLGQRLFHGLGYAELRQLGLSLSLNNLDETLLLVKQVMGYDLQA